MNAAVLEMPVAIPRLEPGDQLHREEFERRYRAMPNCKKAELIEGVVYMPSPVRFKSHTKPHVWLVTWLGTYEAATPGVEAIDNASVRLDLENEPQPDCGLLIHPDRGGQAYISADDYVVGAPEFVAEVSGSTLAIDRGPKLRTFQRHGVKEYLIYRTGDQRLEWNVLQDGNYRQMSPDPDGVFRSQVFPGLWLHADSVIQGNLANVLAVLRQGLASVEHQQFVEELTRRRQ